MASNTSFGTWVQQQRKRLDLTQADLAKQVGCALVTLKKIEQDARRPSRDLARLLAEALHIPVEAQEYFVAVARGQPQLSLLEPKLAEVQTRTPAGYRFVGRHREVARLDHAFEKVVAGQGQILFVTGEAGRGKTSLLVEFARRAQVRSPAVIVAGGGCNAFAGTGDPYLPFRDVMVTLTGEGDPRWAQAIAPQQTTQLLQLFPYTVRTLLDYGPDLLDVLAPSTLLQQRLEALLPAEKLLRRQLQTLIQQRATRSTNPEQQQIYEQTRCVLQAFSQAAPLVLLLDDLQWADQASINLLFHLAQRVTNSRVLIIGALRASEITAAPGDEPPSAPSALWVMINELKRYLGEIEIDLEQTSHSENRAFVDALLDTEANQLSPHFRAGLFARTQGYPLFTVELLHALQERGDLVRDESGHWVEGETLAWERLPTRIEATVAQRIGRLPPPLQQVLRLAAVEGELFTAEVIAHVLGVSGYAITRQLSSALSQHARLVEGQGSHHVAGQRLSHYRFRHALFQTYLYQQIEQVERSGLHEAVGNALEAFYSAERAEIAPQLARHFEEAGVIAKSCDYLLMAGKRALDLAAYTEAATHLAKGRALLQQLPATRTRDQLELEMLIPLGVALTATKHIVSQEVMDTYQRVQVLCLQLEQPLNAPSIRALAIAALLRGELQQTHTLGTELLTIAQQRNDAALASEAHYALGVNYFWLGNLIASRHHLENAVACYAPQQAARHVTAFGWNPKAVCLCRLAYTLWYLGYPTQAVATAEQALAFAQALGHPFSLAYVLCFSTWLYHDCRDLAKAQGMIEHALVLLQKHSFPHWQLMAQILQGRLIAAQGETTQGIAQMHTAMAACQRLQLQSGQPYYYGLLAQIYLDTGASEAGLAAVQRGLALIRTYGDCHYAAELYRLQGELLLATGGNAAKADVQRTAEACFQKAIRIAQQQAAKALELRAATSLSQLWLEQGKTQAAHQLLGAVYSWFTEGFETPDLQAAKAVLDQITAKPV